MKINDSENFIFKLSLTLFQPINKETYYFKGVNCIVDLNFK